MFGQGFLLSYEIFFAERLLKVSTRRLVRPLIVASNKRIAKTIKCFSHLANSRVSQEHQRHNKQ